MNLIQQNFSFIVRMLSKIGVISVLSLNIAFCSDPLGIDVITTSPTLAAGNFHTCHLDTGEVTCWGAGTSLEDDSPNFGQSRTPETLSNPTLIAAGFLHTCVFDTDNFVCWGAGDSTDDSSEEERHLGQSIPTVFDIPETSEVSSLTVGRFHTCVIIDSQVECWGAGTDDTIVENYEYGQSNIPTDLGETTKVSAGGFHTCALTTSQEIRCWGAGTEGTSGVNNEGQAIVPASLGPVLDVAAGDVHTCALLETGSIRCFGNNASGQLSEPIVSGASILEAGGQHSCVIGDSLVCWGAGIIDTGTTPHHGQSNLPDLSDVTAVSLGDSHTCAAHNDGISCWGAGTLNKDAAPDLGQSIVPAKLK